jgi:uncharacterized protein (TIGR03435 family)
MNALANLSGAIFTAVLNSLWQAGLIAAFVWIALRFAPRVNAATRYWIWWTALAVIIALPFAPAILPSQHRNAKQASPAAAASPGANPGMPPLPGAPAAVTLPPDASGRWPLALLALWAAVFAAGEMRVLRSYLHMRRVKRRARIWPASLPPTGRPATLALSNEIASPIAVGFLRPAVILPEALPDALEAAELDHVLLHEAAHIARRDDWTNLAARLVGPALALDPVALWILRRLESEREIACDDWVVARSGSARAYAASLGRLFELRWRNRNELLASGAFGGPSRLSDRIARLLRRGREFSPRASLARVGVSALALLVLVAAASRAPKWIAFAQAAPGFAVASIKPDPVRVPQTLKINPDGIAFTGVSLVTMIHAAYNVLDFQIVGGAPYNRAEYDVTAKSDGNASREQLMLMLRSLLADRFKLAVHTESKELPVIVLVAGKGGSKLHPSAEEGPPGVAIADGGLKFTRFAMPEFGEFLSHLASVGRPVLDRTSLSGFYDFTLLVDGQKFDSPGDAKRSIADWSSIFDDVQSQLGLKLESGKAPIEQLVIDHAEKPTEN